nr:uncharacterized protein LOC105321961 isoform X3 [Crassostrea gigas]
MRTFWFEFYIFFSSCSTVYSLKMKSWKVWQLLALIFPSYLCGSTIGVEIKLCSPAIKNEPCNMTCHVQDFSQPIDINCNGTSRGSCSNIFCPPNMIKEGGNTIHLEIASLSYAMDNCNWTCTFGIVFSSAKRLEVKSGILEPINITSQNNANGGVKLTATADCLHPASPIVIVQYSEQRTGSYASLTQQVDLESSNNIGGCSDAVERRVTAMSDVSAEHEELAGKNVFFKMRFSQYPAGPFTYTNVTGPFSFEGCKYSDAELFLGGFSCFLIVFGITSIIMLIFLLCQMLPKIFEDKKTNKIIFIVVFNSFALIFGFALGFGLKECEKRDLGLGLGLGFGFILAIALVLTLYIYHKQCGSKKENEDENRESPPKFNSKKPEDSPKRVGSPASTSNIKMESKNKTDVLKGDQSALNQKVLHSPLPLPAVDNSQPSKASDDKLSRKKLDPIAVENEEANSSEKKKKKKKRKKKKIDNETADNNVEEAGDNGNLN